MTETISDKQAIFLFIVFMIGRVGFNGTGVPAGSDLWLATLLAVALSFPLLFIYIRIRYLFPHMDLFEITEFVLGRIIGKIIILLFVWISFFVGAMTLWEEGAFLSTIPMDATPVVAFYLLIISMCILVVKEGVEVLSRCATVFIFIMLFSTIIITLMNFENYDIKNIQPVLYNGINPVLRGAFNSLSCPFGEAILIIFLFPTLKSKKSYYNCILISFAFIGIFFTVISTISVMTLGPVIFNTSYFPLFQSAIKAEIGPFPLFNTVTIILLVTFRMASFVTIAGCLLISCKGIGNTFQFNNYRFLVIPTGLLMINFTSFVFDNTMDYHYFLFNTCPFLKIPFIIVFPIIILIAAEMKKRKIKNGNTDLKVE